VNAKIMRRLLPNAMLHVYPDGHLGLLSGAQEIAPIVADFLRPSATPTRPGGDRTGGPVPGPG
ncbi:MAG: poly(3-hydroxyalkanoate) depolymerase, partial [Mycobacteriales bacterium]